MANAYGASTIGKLGNLLPQGQPNERKTSGEDRQWGGDGFKYSHQAMADTDRPGLSLRQVEEDETRNIWSEGDFSTKNLVGIERWPAGQGYYQHEWEEPRTVEPGVGCTVNGYNFRNDLLRALGNSVVEQTAELAFKTLYKKHFDD